VASISFFEISESKDSFISSEKDSGERLITFKISVMGHHTGCLNNIEKKLLPSSTTSTTEVTI
jgi:hypothetical protein